MNPFAEHLIQIITLYWVIKQYILQTYYNELECIHIEQNFHEISIYDLIKANDYQESVGDNSDVYDQLIESNTLSD